MLLKASAKQYDAIIVPGVPLENGQWSRTMKGRVLWSKYLFDKGIAKNIIYSGSAVYSPYCEATIMRLYAEALGIPKENIFEEPKAEHSTENIYYSNKLARQLGFTKIAVASDPFQTKLLRRFVHKKVDAAIDLIPMVEDTIESMNPETINPIIDIDKAFRKDFVPLIERETFWQRFRGTRGLSIDTSAYPYPVQ